VAVDECLYRRRQLMSGEIEMPQNFPRDILRGILSPMFGGVECDDADRVAILAGHQAGDVGFEIGLGDIGFRECRALIVDDEIKSLIVAVRHNRRDDPVPTHRQCSTIAIPRNLSTNLGIVPTQKMRPRSNSSEARNRNEVHPLVTALDCDTGIAGFNRCLPAERAAPFSQQAPGQSPSRLRSPPEI
jgi:hypothetical protein